MANGPLNGLKISPKVLLTGAGFTKDFGGFLADEMWSFIFNSRSLDDFPKIKDLLRSDFSYESVYHEILEGVYGKGEKEAIKQAVKSAYDRLDENIRNASGSTKANSTSMSFFIEEFRGKPETGKGFFFTLNQDIFIERYCRSNSNYSLIIPGTTLQAFTQNRPLSDLDYQRLPDEKTVAKVFDIGHPHNPLRSSNFHYVKLHGSYHLRDSEGNAYMVIGKRKTEQISKEPLFRDYFSLFEGVLSSGDIELFVIGYGFCDEHINKVIADSVANHRLRLYILSPISPDEFKRDLQSKPRCGCLWDTLQGYYPYSVSRVFPSDSNAKSSTIEYMQIIKDFFQR